MYNRQLSIFSIVLLFAAVTSFGGRGKQAISSGNLHGHRLLNHLLDIGEDPNEDIRTNVLLAMEGL